MPPVPRRADCTTIAGVGSAPAGCAGPSKYLKCLDSLLSIVQRPKGIPLASFAISEADDPMILPVATLGMWVRFGVLGGVVAVGLSGSVYPSSVSCGRDRRMAPMPETYLCGNKNNVKAIQRVFHLSR